MVKVFIEIVNKSKINCYFPTTCPQIDLKQSDKSSRSTIRKWPLGIVGIVCTSGEGFIEVVDKSIEN